MSGFKTRDGRLLTDVFLTNEELMSRCVGNRLIGLGCNNYGQLGDGTVTGKCSPQSIASSTNWSVVKAGLQTTLALKTDGTLWGWGRNTDGQLGTNNRVHYSSPVQTVAGGTNWARITGAGSVSAAIKSDGTLWLWGWGRNGSLGIGCCGYSVLRSSPVQTVTGGTDWCRVSVLTDRVNAIKCDGTMWQWGLVRNYDSYGGNCVVISPTQHGSSTDWKEVGGTTYAAIAQKKDLTLWSWGSNFYGELGTNESHTTRRSSPVQITPGGKLWRTFTDGIGSTAAGIRVDGSLWTWGDNYYGVLNTGDCYSRSSPVQTVAGGTNWKCVSVGGAVAMAAIDTLDRVTVWGGPVGNAGAQCAITPDEIFVWGDGFNMYVTNATSTSTPSRLRKNAQPGGVYNNWTLVGAHAGGGGTCGFGGFCVYCPQAVALANKSDGSLWAWGCNRYGQLGNLSTANSFSSPVQVCAANTTWCQIGGYLEVSAGITTGGELWLWGRGHCGMLGDGTITNKSSPVQTACGGTNWKQFAATRRAVGAVKHDGTLWTWGHNGCAALGINSGSDSANRCIPGQTAAGGTTWTCVGASFFGFGGVKSDGSVWTWGDNRCAQTGAPATAGCKISPSMMTYGQAGCNWVGIYGSALSFVGLKSDGTLWSWGCIGPAGNGTVVSTCSHSPVQAFGTGWCKVSKSESVVIAQKTDGTVWSWGFNPDHGITGCTETVLSPVQISSMTGAGWKSFATSDSNGIQIGIVCCFPVNYSIFCPGPRPFGYTSIKSVSVGSGHILMTRFIGEEL